MSSSIGLQTNGTTWLITISSCLLWMFSIRLVPRWEVDGWRSVLKSAYGFFWLSFGFDIFVRFLLLTHECVEWANGTLRLAVLPADTVNRTLSYCVLFWLLAAASYAAAGKTRSAGPFSATSLIDCGLAYEAAVSITLFSCLVFYLTEGSGRLPLSLVTPLALLANLYMVPACVIWWDHFRKSEAIWRIRPVHLLVFAPSLVRGWISPYRENLSPILLIPLLAAVFAGRKLYLRKLVPLGVIFFLVVSTAIGSYRRVKWENVTPQEVGREISEAGFSGWITGSWAEPLHRFHAFDSMLLTVALIPTARPYSGRSLLIAPFIRAVVPRLFYQGKQAADEGMQFGSRIWAFDNPWARVHSDAAIAPSMPGDLFDAGGVSFVAFGAVLWGALLGLIDGWKSHLPSFADAGLTVLLASQCAMSVERDFDNTVATVLQTLLALVGVCAILRVARRSNGLTWNSKSPQAGFE
jgi:hypothetical protein